MYNPLTNLSKPPYDHCSNSLCVLPGQLSMYPCKQPAGHSAVKERAMPTLLLLPHILWFPRQTGEGTAKLPNLQAMLKPANTQVRKYVGKPPLAAAALCSGHASRAACSIRY